MNKNIIQSRNMEIRQKLIIPYALNQNGKYFNMERTSMLYTFQEAELHYKHPFLNGRTVID